MQASASLQIPTYSIFPTPPLHNQTPPHRLCFLHCLLELVQFLIILLFLEPLLASGQQEGMKGLHFGGTVLVDTNLDLVLHAEGVKGSSG